MVTAWRTAGSAVWYRSGNRAPAVRGPPHAYRAALPPELEFSPGPACRYAPHDHTKRRTVCMSACHTCLLYSIATRPIEEMSRPASAAYAVAHCNLREPIMAARATSCLGQPKTQTLRPNPVRQKAVEGARGERKPSAHLRKRRLLSWMETNGLYRRHVRVCAVARKTTGHVISAITETGASQSQTSRRAARDWCSLVSVGIQFLFPRFAAACRLSV
jgi:hypothetical protein